MAAEEELQQEDELPLEEKIKQLQDEGFEPKKVVEKILEENLNANIATLCTLTGLNNLDVGRIKGRLSKLAKARQRKLEPESTAGRGPYKDEADTANVLKSILTKFPDMSTKVIDEICSWQDLYNRPLHPMELVQLLVSMKGVTNAQANIIAQKYTLAMNKAVQEGKVSLSLLGFTGPDGTKSFGLPPQWPGQPLGAQSQTGQGQPPGFGWPPSPQGGATLDGIRAIIREEMRLKEEGRPARERTLEQEFVEIDTPERNSQGEIIVDGQDRPIMKHVRAPVSIADRFMPKEDVETRVMEKMKNYKDLFGKSEVTLEQVRDTVRDTVRDIVRQEVGAPRDRGEEKPATAAEVQAASEAAAAKAIQAMKAENDKEKKEDERFRRLEDTIARTGSSKTVEGYKEDAFRVLGQGMNEVAKIFSDRKPLEIIFREGGAILSGVPPPKTLETGAQAETLLGRLEQKGWLLAT